MRLPISAFFLFKSICEGYNDSSGNCCISLQFMGKVYIRYPEMDFVYSMFEASLKNYPAVVIDPAEHTEYRWMTLETTLELPLIRGEHECIHLVYRNLFLKVLETQQRQKFP